MTKTPENDFDLDGGKIVINDKLEASIS